MSRDGVAGLAVLAASLVLFALTLGLKDNPLVPIGPGFYPRIVLGVTAVLAAWLVLGDWLAGRAGRRTRKAPGKKDEANYRLVALLFAVFGLYVAALAPLGFRVATFLFVCGSSALLEPTRGARGWLRMAIVGAVTTAVVYVVFERYLLVLLPRGAWTGF